MRAVCAVNSADQENLFTILWNFEIFFRASGTSPAGLGEFESKKSV